MLVLGGLVLAVAVRGRVVLAVGAGAAGVVQNFVDRGLLQFPQPGRLALTDAGRLLADGIITDILVAEDDTTADGEARS